MAAWDRNKKLLTAQGQKARDFEKEAYNEVFDENGTYIGYPQYVFKVDWEKYGNPPAWCEATADYIQSEGLCETCSKYDFKELLKESETNNPNLVKSELPSYRITLGPIHQIMDKTDCSFCQFLLAVALCLYPTTGVPTGAECTLAREDGAWQGRATFSVDCTGIKGPDGTDFPSMGRELGIWRDYPWPLGKTPPNPIAGQDLEGFGLLQMASLLFELCIDAHPKCRQQETLGIEMTTALFFIDLQTIKIVRAPEKSKYAALSYVWGKNTGLERSNLIYPVNSSEDVEIDLPENVPVTIAHALNVTKQLGIRYLWVDQLCIPVDTHSQQVAEMDKIYRNATLTIVAAVQDSGSGLPGVGIMNRKRFAPPILRVNDLNIGVKMPPNLFRALENSAWINRGWAYQEKVLSSRLLYFTEEDIYYQCLEGEKCEQDCHADNTVSYTRETLVELGSVLATAHGRVPFQIFGDCVHAYTRRGLTYPDDILNAFTGLMSYLSNRFEWVFCWGLPNDNFAFALLWTSSSTTRREARDSHDRLFPSWSWAGWIGDATYEGITSKSMANPGGIFPDFVPVSWDLGMLENAIESGILILKAECVEITEENCGIFLFPTLYGKFEPSESTRSWIGCTFAAIALMADKESMVRGLIITKPRTQNGCDVVERMNTAGVKPEIWLASSREMTTVNIA